MKRIADALKGLAKKIVKAFSDIVRYVACVVLSFFVKVVVL